MSWLLYRHLSSYDTLSLFMLMCQLPCVIAQCLLYSKMTIFLFAHFMGQESNVFLNFIYLLCFPNASCQDFTRIKCDALCQVKKLSESVQEKQCRCAIHILAEDQCFLQYISHYSSLAKHSCSICIWLFRQTVNRA